MAFDIVYDQQTNQVLKVLAHPNKMGIKGTTHPNIVFPAFHKHNIDCNMATWVPSVPSESLSCPGKFKVEFDEGYSKPLRMICPDGRKFDLKLNTKIKDRKIIWCGGMWDYVSYSNISRSLSKELLSRGYNIGLVAHRAQGKVEIPNEEFEYLKTKMADEKEIVGNNHLKIWSYVPTIKMPHSACNVTYTMLESFDIQPRTIYGLNVYSNEIWTPTEFSKNQWRSVINERIPIQVMPLWFEKEKFYPGVEKVNVDFEVLNDDSEKYPKEPTGFKFFNVSRYSYRKGFDVLLKAYIEGFDATKDDVSLVLFTRHIMNLDKFKVPVVNELKEMIRACKNPNKPPVYLCYDAIHESDKGGMYGWGDCLVSPSRGEGFGLPVVEAAACKIPVISPNHTGLSDFVDDSVAYVLDTDMTDNIGTALLNPDGTWNYQGKYPGWTQWVTEFYANAHFAVMGESVVRQCREHMRNIYEGNYKDVEEKVDKFHRRVHDRFTWEVCAERVCKRIDYLLDTFS